MLVTLEVSHFVLIKHAQFDFKKGLTVFTGETGSGKSVLFDALGLLFGERADIKMIRYGQNMATIQGEFSALNPSLIEVLQEEGIPLEGDTLWIKRILYQDGRSKAFVNDMSVRTRTLKDMAPFLGEICGQFSGYRLLDTGEYVSQLDQFAGLKEDVSLLSKSYKDMMEAQKRYDDTASKLEQAEREKAFLEHAVMELEQALTLGEEEELSQRCFVLKNREKVSKALFEIEGFLNGSGGVIDGLDKAQICLDRLPDGVREDFSSLYDSLEKARIEVKEEALPLLHSYQGEEEGESLEALEEKLYRLRSLIRKYHITDGKIENKFQEFKESLETLEQGQDRLDDLKVEIAKCCDLYNAQALSISQKRQDAARILQERIMDELQFLKLENAAFAVVVRQDEERMTKEGIDQVQFLLSPHKGAPLLPLASIASGGEISRILLALQVCLNPKEGLIVFDEIDSGMGGAAADAVGERLRLLARHMQVFTITHAPQVAAKGDYHIRIHKEEAKDTDDTEAVYTWLNGDVRIEEVARMLSGAKVTEEARLVAQKLLSDEV